MQETIKRVGDRVKSIEGNRIVGYLVRFTRPNDTDLYGDYFTKDTQFMLGAGHSVKGKPILLEHGLDDFAGLLPIGIFDTERLDDVGLWVEGKLADREEYEEWLSSINYKGLTSDEISQRAEIAAKAVRQLLSTGKAQFSSGALPQSVIRGDDGHIKGWVIIEGSVTVTPAEPNGTQATIKSKIGDKPMGKKQFDEMTDDMLEIEEVKGDYTDEVLKVLETTKQEIVAVIEEVISGLRPDELAEVAEVVEDELEDVAAQTKMTDEEESEEDMKALRKAIAKRQDAIISAGVAKAKKAQANRKSKMMAVAQAAANKSAMPKTRQAPAVIGSRGDTPFADFVKGISSGSTKAQNPNIGALGGYLVGQTLADEILPPLRAQSVAFRAGVRQTLVPNTGTYVLPKMVTAPQAYRPGINQPVTDSDAVFGTITAQMRPIAAQVIIPKQLLMTSPLRVEETIREQLIRSLQLTIDLEIFQGLGAVGSGTGQEIKGILRSLQTELPANVLAPLGTNGGVPSYQNLVAMETQLASGNIPTDDTTSFIMHPRDRGTLRALTDTVGQPLLRANYGDRAYEDMLGYPVYTSTALATNVTTGSSTDTSRIYYGSFGFSEYVMSNDIEFMVDEVTLMNNLQIRIIAYTYSDFIIHYPEAFVALTGVRPL